MPTLITKYTDEHIVAVQEFNARMRHAGALAEFELPSAPEPVWLSKSDGKTPWNEYYLVLVNGAVRGAFTLKHEDFSFGGTVRSVSCCHHAYSEGAIDKSYATIGAQIFRYCEVRHPLIYAMGMQGYNQPLPRMLIKMGWSHCLLPFYIRILNPRSFFDNLRMFSRSGALNTMKVVEQKTGFAGLVVRAAQHAAGSLWAPGKVNFDIVADFDEWANSVWEDSKRRYTALALRTAEVLRLLYPADNHNFIRLKVTSQGKIVGWAVVGHLQRKEDRNYGNLYVGAVLDTLASPEYATLVTSAATAALEELGVDLIISNQSHAGWRRALRKCGYLRAPSNYIFATSEQMTKNMGPFHQTVPSAHLNRSGADGLFPYIFLSTDRPSLPGSPSAQNASRALAS
jgi:hypothetical protein